MLNLQVTIIGDKVVIAGLEKAMKEVPVAVREGLEEAARAILQEADKNLSGAGSKGTSEWRTSKKSGKKYMKWTKRKEPIPAGGYPVPVRTGHLQKWGNYAKPGESKTSNGITFKAGSNEAIVYNAAEYARVIHEGKGSSAKYGPRPFITDAVGKVDIAGIIEKKLAGVMP
ncbi:MAG: hypothetical protein Q8J64_06570 [Thermodesulfovibrionales bacterium]|nr:hypothetical protein [Thermodesulfovibrionales bacterium]